MRHIVIASLATLLLAACGGSSTSKSTPDGGTTTVSCVWGAGTCDQYGGTIDPTFAENLSTVCAQHGVAYATGPCPSVNQVAGYCDLGTNGGMSSSYHYYSPTYDGTSAQADCSGLGTWVP
jgi:hypothetical protein